jgi:hypothetical protein
MSLRNSSGEDFEKPEKEGALEAGIKKAHQLIQCGPRGWRCICSKIYSHASNRREAEAYHLIHQKAVVEFMTDQRNGVSNYGD